MKWTRMPAGLIANERLALCGDQGLLLLLLLLTINEKHARAGLLTDAESAPDYLSRVGRLWQFAQTTEQVQAGLVALEREGFVRLRAFNGSDRIEIADELFPGKPERLNGDDAADQGSQPSQ